MNRATLLDLLGPRYYWAADTEPVKRVLAYAEAMEEKLNEARAVKACECPPTPEPGCAP